MTRNLFTRAQSPRRTTARAITAGLAAAGGALAAMAVWAWRSARRAERRHPPAGRFIEVNGVRLHYVQSGEGEPVVLLHGNGSMAEDFVGSPLFDELARRHRVLAIDRPGFGYSGRPRAALWTPRAQADLLAGALPRLGIERPVIVGHSWGAMVALAMALRAPDAVRGLLLVSGYFYPTPRLEVLLQSLPAIPILGDLLRYTVSPALGRLTTPFLVRQLFAPQQVPDAFWAHVPLGMMLRPWQLRAAAAEAAMMVPAAAALAPHYGEVGVPVTVVAGTEDHIADYRTQSTRLRQQLPSGNLLLIHGMGHMLHYVAPEQLAEAVQDVFTASAPAPVPATR